MRFILVPLLFLFSISIAHAIDTPELTLRRGSTNDGAVRITRDGAGCLVFEDVYTSPTTLYTIVRSRTAHSALSGLLADDHPQYQTAGRHAGTHDQLFNAQLAIPTDGGGNTTLGDHVLDGDLHLRREADEDITGGWDFEDGLMVLQGAMTLGPGQFDADPSIRFADSPADAAISFDTADRAFRVNRPVLAATIGVTTLLDGRSAGQRSAALEGFASIEGIAPADLLASTRPESVSASWTFLADLSVHRMVQPGLPALVWKARNIDDAALDPGDALVWSTLSDSDELQVEKLDDFPEPLTPFAGFAATAAFPDALVEIIIMGVVDAPASEAISPGARLTWNGSSVVVFDSEDTSVSLGLALEGVAANERIRLLIGREVIVAP